MAPVLKTSGVIRLFADVIRTRLMNLVGGTNLDRTWIGNSKYASPDAHVLSSPSCHNLIHFVFTPPIYHTTHLLDIE